MENTSPQNDHDLRLCQYQQLSAFLENLSDTDLTKFTDQGELLHTGTGGSSLKLEMDGIPTFVKLVPLNELENKSQSTQNLFNLPTFYQYGVGSAGFNTWREVKAHETSTQWVLSNKNPNFPMLYHWRALQKSQANQPLDQEKLAQKVQYWENTFAIGERLKANHFASTHVALFLEYIPQNLNHWLESQLKLGHDDLDQAIKMVENEFFSTVHFMNNQEMIHFDAHFWNILTDGNHLYFSDFGLANCSKFDLSNEEQDFYQNHLNYDRCYGATQLVYWLISHLFGEQEADEILAIYALGTIPDHLPNTVTPYLNSVMMRYAPIAGVMNAFIKELRLKTKRACYPHKKLEKLWLRSQK